MAEWRIRLEDSEKRWSERYIVQRLQGGHLLGSELVCSIDGDTWTPLYQTAMYRRALGEGDPRRRATIRAVMPFLEHLAVYVMIVAFMGFPSWALWWGIGLAAHALKTGQLVWEARDLPNVLPPLSAEPAVRPAATPLLLAIDGLRDLLRDRPPEDPLRLEMDQLAAAAVTLEGRQAALAGLVEPATLDALRRERDGVTDPRERVALDERLRTTEQALETRERLASECRALLHQVEGLRVAMLTAEASAQAPDLVPRVRELRLRTAADAEVQDMGRRAAARGRAAQ